MLSSLFLSKPSLQGISDQYSVMLADSPFFRALSSPRLSHSRKIPFVKV